MYEVLSLLIFRPPVLSAASACFSMWAASSGEFAMMLRLSTKIRRDRMCLSMLKPFWLVFQMS